MRRASPEEGEIPPAVTCPVCGRADCSGCPASEVAVATDGVPWEGGAGGFGERLFGTAHLGSVEPEQLFGRIADGRVAPALRFAVWAESVALGSFMVLALLGLHLWDPDLTWRIASDPFVALLLALAVLLAVGVMVALHALWGICLELSARASRARSKRAPLGFSRGLRFGLYACGWDLLTSPAGLGHGLLNPRIERAWWPIYRAIRAPRPAMCAYLERSHGLDRRARDRAARLSVWVLGGTTLALSVLLGVALVRFVSEFVWG